ncbi:putative PH domain-containing protein PB16A4.02c like [Verticillium longisporum]|uniref:Putative PH domain-containing protein PB16A4.02c like n=1 Tax=Verticillium longisporum TaxID=100787 RepID=A0A8I3AM98_VERLO|nr:putative PH domain-containing protein PB16A4.02c like [Verticillium longisporum]
MLDTYASPVNQNGSFEFDREVKSGHVQKRTQKTKTWKSIYLVLRPNALSLYKTDKEDKLRHKINLSDLTAVALLRDPKQKRKHVFGCFSPAKNYHFQAKDDNDAQQWVDLIRTYARIDEEEEELLLASPVAQRGSYLPPISNGSYADPALRERVTSSSPEPLDPPAPRFISTDKRRPSNMLDSSGYSGNELASHSDFSDTEMQRLRGMSIEDLAGQSPQDSGVSGLNLEHDPDRVIWQGWLWFLRNKGGFLRPMSAIVDVVDIDPVSKTKCHCLQLITDEKSYRFCAPDEESLVLCLGAFKSLLAKRRELEARAAANASHATAIPAPVTTV